MTYSRVMPHADLASLLMPIATDRPSRIRSQLRAEGDEPRRALGTPSFAR